MAGFTLYIKKKTTAVGSKESAEKAVTLLLTYIKAAIDKQTTFDSSDVKLVDESTSPTLQDTDVIVYVVRNTDKSVIKGQGGTIAMAEANDKVLGMTDLNKKICEVYYDRLYDGSAKEFAGACYHEAAHIKSNQDNAMHTGKDGFLSASPDYNGSPTDKNTEFFAKNLGRKVTMTSSY
jgi:hypothetical protein